MALMFIGPSKYIANTTYKFSELQGKSMVRGHKVAINKHHENITVGWLGGKLRI